MIMDSPNVYGESGWLLQSRIVEFAKEMPRDRLVFGTDSPPNDPGMWLTHLEVLCHEPPQGLNIGEDQLEDYMGNNIARLVGIQPTAPPETVEDAKKQLEEGATAGRSTDRRGRDDAWDRHRSDARLRFRSGRPRVVAAYEAAFPDDVMMVGERVAAAQDVTALVWTLAGDGRHPMLHLRDIAGIEPEVVTNVFASRQRVARILGATEATLHDVYQAKASAAVPPQEVSDAAVTAEVQEGDAVDLASLPLLTHFETDRAPYITSGIMVGEDPDGVGNLSYHRSMIHSPTELATSLHSRGDLWRLLGAAAERGEPLRVAMVLGGHPLFMLAASARVPMSVDERTSPEACSGARSR